MAIRHGTMLSSCDIDSLVEITSRKTIKPSSPTPPHNRILKLSLLDQIMPPTVYGTILWFFPNHNASDFASKSSESTTTKSKRLQDSLSKALVQFYPMAGRVKSPALIECNDEGAHFLEARVNCQLSDLLIQPNPESLNHLMAQNDPKTANEALGSTLLLVQISVFNCGGIVVSVSASHKIADAASLLTFVRAWAAINRDGVLELQLGTPEFTGGSLLPPRELSLPSSKVNLEIPTQSLVTKRFVFNVSKMVSLKEKIGSVVQAFIPSTSHLVLAIILKCSIAASRQCKPESSIKPTVLSQMVSFRKRIVPEKSENVMGNWFWPIQVLFKENEIELHDLASKMRQGLTEFRNEKASRFKGEDGFLVISECLRERNDINSANVYRTSSLCKLPLYEMDFGWGKPAWVTSLSVLKNIILLVDTKEKDGIEAW
ncbi:BAHD acyltransferase [Pyrus ussuriensis x Pyrus communis]|uniref:BAHD acyltransferase n=1 Tax=Pyrus ussuriensis x Pyrus communis TaxID=2448454 RepID=A0A5N5GGH9_9ROSA|nr:BAHD acyltransferase [Pyrus ussuriensis x Pyrus communis]